MNETTEKTLVIVSEITNIATNQEIPITDRLEYLDMISDAVDSLRDKLTEQKKI